MKCIMFEALVTFSTMDHLEAKARDGALKLEPTPLFQDFTIVKLSAHMETRK